MSVSRTVKRNDFALSNLIVAFLCFFLFFGLPVFAAEHGGGASKEAAPAEGGAAPEEKGKDKGNTDITGGRFAGDPVYVHLQPFNLSIIRKYGAEQLATFVIDLEVKELSVANDLYMQMPRIKDRLLQTLYVGLGNGTLLIDGRYMNLAKIKEKCKEDLNKVFGEGTVQNVLFQDVAQRIM